MKGNYSAVKSDQSAVKGDQSAVKGDQSAAKGDQSAAKGYENYTILGRTSVDIIKSAGYKISALQIEGVLLEHPDAQEVAVLGVSDQVYGEVVTALVVPRKDADGKPVRPDQDVVADLKKLCAARLAPYQAPREYKIIDALPRNAMGKVNKKELKKTFFPAPAA